MIRKGLVLSLCSIICWSPAFAQPDDIGLLRSRALENYHEGRYEEAAQLYQQIIAVRPRDIDTLRNLMWVLWKDEKFVESGKVAKQLLAMKPGDQEAKGILEKTPKLALRAQASADFHAGRFVAASKIYRQLAQMEPRNVSVLKDFMWSLWEIENYQEAHDVAVRILSIDKNEAEAKDMIKRAPSAELRARAVAFYRAGEYEKAVDAYQHLLAQSPKSAGILKDIYWCLWQLGKYPEVTDIAVQITDLDPRDADAWNLLGRAYVANEKLEEGLQAYERSLSINPKQPDTQRVVGRLHVDLREFDSAINVLSDLEKRDPSIRMVYPQLAKAQFFKGNYVESAQNWAKAAELYPENDNYRLHEARALYYNGQTKLALSKMESLALGSGPMKWMAIDFMVDDALARHDLKRATGLLEDNLKDPIQISEESRLLKLATVYLENQMPKKCLKVLNRYLKINPNNIPALLIKADELYAVKRYFAASQIYRRVQALNPYSIAAFGGLANSEFARNNPDVALKSFKKALALDPTDPYLIILYAHYLAEAGFRKKSQVMLKNWLKENKVRVTIPILLYHGLTPFSRDPLLAYPVHVKVSVFEDHIRALKQAGYTPITTDQLVGWYKKNAPLPKKPVLITFDDGRLDSFRYGDPVLEKYNFKATMFVPIANIEGHMPPSYVSWNQILESQRSGRWEFQSHGDMGHTRVNVDAVGRQGLFLINRQWLEKENRLETIQEWKDRILNDHISTKKKMTKMLGKAPASYAYPEGTYGQIDSINSPEAVPVNIEAIKKVFFAAYHQDFYGINVRSRDPLFLTRLEPHPNWTGEQLVTYLQDKNPYVLATRQLLWAATWEGRPMKADHYLKDLRAEGASQVVLLGEEGRIRSALGDVGGARSRIESARSKGEDQNNDKLYEAVKVQGSALLAPGYTYSEDNRNRYNSIFETTLRPFPVSKFNLGIDYMYGSYKERSVPTVTQNGAGLSFVWTPSYFHTITGRGMWHWFPEKTWINNTYGASLGIESRWTDGFTTEVSGGRALYDTAHALLDEVTENYGNLFASWRQDGPLRLSAKFQGAKLSDENKRVGASGSISSDLFWNVRAVYKYTYDDMDNISPAYYSPQHLQQHQLGLEYAAQYRWFEPSISYLPGIGKETGTSQDFIQDVQASFNIRLSKRTLFQPTYSFTQTPTYRRHTVNALLTHHF